MWTSEPTGPGDRATALRSTVEARVTGLRNLSPVTSFSARKTATELGREVSACQS